MNLIGIEVYPEKKITYVFSNRSDFEKEEWCSFKKNEATKIGRVKFIASLKGEKSPPEKIRKASLRDKQEFDRRREIEKKAFQVALKKITHYELSMELVKVSYPLEINQITLYYTAKERVDFRALVKDLAKMFKVRIQMQQIGVRDEAKLLVGCGICGREVCCASFLSKKCGKLDSVNLEKARVQNLPLISSKISGICGRLRCCLNFEYPTYDNNSKEKDSSDK
ncbi:MAG: regulatory iron-sulfur-containing complex subunit RicT [Candidatus Aerophobetes bacterium]|nr:regulatory iron-sulfur-containing complex subunit RicT [Candidatus Aerophobetes bacterium]